MHPVAEVGPGDSRLDGAIQVIKHAIRSPMAIIPLGRDRQQPGRDDPNGRMYYTSLRMCVST